MACSRRLEDRIRELAACLAISPEDELHTIMFALQAAMQEYMRRLENSLQLLMVGRSSGRKGVKLGNPAECC